MNVVGQIRFGGDRVGGRTRFDKTNENETYEWLDAHTAFDNPLERVIDPKGRGLNVPFAVLDAFEMLAGHDGSVSSRWNKFMQKFVDPVKGDVPGSYGRRINFQPTRDPNVSQFGRCFEELKANPDSRRAVVVINNPYYENYMGNNVACTLNLQYLIREGKLVAITNMRSNDAYKGFCYDTFAFQFFQELLAAELGVPVGRYYHNAASLHVYVSDLDRLKEMGSDSPYDEVPPLPIRSGIDETEAGMVINDIALIPTMVDDVVFQTVQDAWRLDGYLGNCATLIAFEYYRRAKDWRARGLANSLTNEFKVYAARKMDPSGNKDNL